MLIARTNIRNGHGFKTSQMAGFGKYEFKMIKQAEIVYILVVHLNVY